MTEEALILLKYRLGISKDSRDEYLNAIIESVVYEMDAFGVTLDESNSYHLMFVVDFSAWKYENKGSDKGIPRHLQYRLHNLMIGGY